MYVRCKRTNQTLFLYVEPTDTVSSLIGKVSYISKKPNENIRLIFQDAPLDPEKTLGDCKVENDNVLYFVFGDGGKLVCPF